MNSFSACLAKNEEYSVPCSPSSTNSSPTTTTTKEPGLAGGPTTGVGSLNNPPHSSAKPHCNTTTHYYPHRGNQARNSVGASSSHLSGITAAVFFPAYHNMDQNMEYYPTGSVVGQTLATPTPPPPPPPPQAKKEKSPSLTIDRAAFLLLRVKKAFKRKRQQRKEKQ